MSCWAQADGIRSRALGVDLEIAAPEEPGVYGRLHNLRVELAGAYEVLNRAIAAAEEMRVSRDKWLWRWVLTFGTLMAVIVAVGVLVWWGR